MGLMTPMVMDDRPGNATPGLAAPGTPMPREDEQGQKRDTPREADESDEKGPSSSSKSENSSNSSPDDVEEMIARDRGQSSKKARTEGRADEGMNISVSEAPGTGSKRGAETQALGESSPK